MKIGEIQKKIPKIFLDVYEAAFKLVVVNTRFYWERILVTGCQYVNN